MADSLFATEAMREVFADRARIARMLDFEAALARAEAAAGVIPQAAADAIARNCTTAGFDIAAISRDARKAGNLAIPLVAALTRKVGASAPDAKGYVHWGATSQDVIDTGLVLQLRDALALIDADVERLATALALQTRKHATTVLAGRTWLQQALPVTLGAKLAAVLSAVDRHRGRLKALRRTSLVVQFGGAAGTLASLGQRGIAVSEALAADLALDMPDMPWHTQRDRLCDIAATLGMLTATLGKLARDIALLAQSEVSEAREPALPGRGGSSTMPQKRNPVGASIALEAAVRVPALVSTMLTCAVQEHERGLGNWPAEWTTLPEIALLASGALAAMVEVIEGLDVDADRMRANLDVTQGLIFAEAVQMALAPSLGRDTAHALVGAASKKSIAEKRSLREVLSEDAKVRAVLDEQALANVFDAATYLGSTHAYIDAVLAQDVARA